MSKTITIFEHEYTTNIGWTDREAQAIFRLNSSLGADVLLPTFRSGQRELRAAEHVGVIRYGNQTVQILPKIYKVGGSFEMSQREEAARQASENLLYLLAVAARFPIRESEIAGLTRHSTDWFEILIYLFAKHLFEEWTKGAVHNY